MSSGRFTCRRITRVIAAMSVAVVVAGCTASVPSSRSGSSGSKNPGSNAGSLQWKPCRQDLQCATLRVPLNWQHKDGSTISLALIRKPALDPHPIGSVVLNPGGPGEPGTEFLPQLLESGTFPQELEQHFAVVSWDPRGTGNSDGVACATPAELEAPDPLPYPPTARERQSVADRQLAIQRRCLRKFADQIPYLGTMQTTRDLDAIRGALGDQKLTYVGFSYGTAIGLEYLKLFGNHVRAMVLDGIDLPGTDPIETTYAQMASFESNLDRFLADCAADAHCTFGAGHPQDALAALLARLSRGTRIPASYSLPDESGTSHSREGTLGYTEAVTGIAAALYNRQSWPVLRTALGAATRSSSPDGHLLLAFRDLLAGRQLNGSWNHSNEARGAISCADQRARATSFFGDVVRIKSWAKKLPVFGAFGAAGLPGCYQWPKALEPLSQLTANELQAAPSVVLVNSEHDPATPYANALEAKKLLPNAVLVTWGGEDHTSFAGGHDCIDRAVVPYLVSLTKPKPGTVCSSVGG